MRHESKQHTLWLLAAMATPLAHFSGSGWFVAGLAALAILPLTFLPKHWDGLPRPLALVQIFWLGAVAGVLLQNSAAYWPSDDRLAVPLTLLALAALTNAAASPRIGAVLAFCIALLLIPAAVSGAARIEPGWLRPTAAPWPWGLSLALLLPNLPASGEGEKGRRTVYTGLIALLTSLLVQGTISARVAASVTDPFYQTARTLGHLEPVIAAAMTLGWYAVTAYLLQSADIIAKNSGFRQKWSSVLAAGTATAFVVFGGQLLRPVLAVLSTFLWVLVPLLTRKRKLEKSEK